MAPRSNPDFTLMFLYVCLLNSGYKTIDYAAVGAATGLNTPAARMRFCRLKKQLDAGMLEGKVNLLPSPESIDAGETSSPASSPAKKKRTTKRKRVDDEPQPKEENEVEDTVEEDFDAEVFADNGEGDDTTTATTVKHGAA